jgi:SAM-dependent methyltransferase
MTDQPHTPQPKFQDSVRERYAGSWGQSYQRQKRSVPEAACPWVARLRARKLAPWIKPHHVVLEYGVGHGWNLAALQCQRRLGYDVAVFLADELRRRGIEFVPETSSLSSASVDVAICHHTLEHVLQPAETLREIKRLMRPSGVLLLFVPFEKERRYRRYDPAEPNQHLYSWNVQTLGNLVAAAGFEVSKVGLGRFGYDRFAAVWASRLRVGDLGFNSLRAILHTLKPAFEVRLVARGPGP